jgi:hypothetical protein
MEIAIKDMIVPIEEDLSDSVTNMPFKIYRNGNLPIALK